MSKILNISLPLKSHLNGTLRLSESLRDRGHEVIFAGMADCGPIVEPHGYKFVPIFEDRFPLGFMQQWMRGGIVLKSWKDRLHFYLEERRKMITHEGFVEYLSQGGFREFNQVIDEIGPDVILVSLGLHAYWALLAHQTGIKCVYVSSTLPTAEDPVAPPFYSLLQPGHDERSTRKVRRAWDQYFNRRDLRSKCLSLLGIPDSIANVKKLARTCGYPLERLNTRTLQFPLLDFTVLVLCPQEFEFPQVQPLANHLYVEASIPCDCFESSFPFEKIESDKTVILASLGSVAYSKVFLQHVIDAVSSEPNWQLIMNIGPSLKPGDFERVPQNAVLVDSIPQIALLQRADVMINHGGIGSVKECIYFGVPQVIFPIGFDQPGAAMRVLCHGLGVVGDFYRANAGGIHSLLRQVLDDRRFKVRSLELSETFQARERQHLAALAIESIVGVQTEFPKSTNPETLAAARPGYFN